MSRSATHGRVANQSSSAAAVGLIENIPLDQAVSQGLYRWLSMEAFEGFEKLFKYHLSEEEYGKFHSDSSGRGKIIEGRHAFDLPQHLSANSRLLSFPSADMGNFYFTQWPPNRAINLLSFLSFLSWCYWALLVQLCMRSFILGHGSCLKKRSAALIR
jgi:hypothetical protein